MSSSGELGAAQRKEETPPEGNPGAVARPSQGSADGSDSSPASAGVLSNRNSDANPEQPASEDNLVKASPADGKLRDRTNVGDEQSQSSAQLAIPMATGSNIETDRTQTGVSGANVVVSPEAAADVHASTTVEPMDTTQEQSESSTPKEFLGFAERVQRQLSEAPDGNSARPVEEDGSASTSSILTPAQLKSAKRRRHREAKKLRQQSESSASAPGKPLTASSGETGKAARSGTHPKPSASPEAPVKRSNRGGNKAGGATGKQGNERSTAQGDGSKGAKVQHKVAPKPFKGWAAQAAIVGSKQACSG